MLIDLQPLVDAMLRSGGDPDENKILEPLQMEQQKLADLANDVTRRVSFSEMTFLAVPSRYFYACNISHFCLNFDEWQNTSPVLVAICAQCTWGLENAKYQS